MNHPCGLPIGVLGDFRFRRFWIAETISVLGSQVTELALPLTAVILLHATPSEMGLLTAVGLLPFLIVGLPAGVWVDRFPKRRILVAADLSVRSRSGSCQSPRSLTRWGWA